MKLLNRKPRAKELVVFALFVALALWLLTACTDAPAPAPKSLQIEVSAVEPAPAPAAAPAAPLPSVKVVAKKQQKSVAKKQQFDQKAENAAYAKAGRNADRAECLSFVADLKAAWYVAYSRLDPEGRNVTTVTDEECEGVLDMKRLMVLLEEAQKR